MALEILTVFLVHNIRVDFLSATKTCSPDTKRILIKVVQNCHYVDSASSSKKAFGICLNLCMSQKSNSIRTVRCSHFDLYHTAILSISSDRNNTKFSQKIENTCHDEEF